MLSVLLTGAHVGDFTGSSTYHGQGCSHQEIKQLGKGVEGKLRPWGGDPACWSHNRGQQQVQEPEPQPSQISAGRLCVHTKYPIHALN